MKQLIQSTSAYRGIGEDAKSGNLAHAMLVLFPDEVYLRTLLKECAKAFFQADGGSRTATLIDKECFADCPVLPAAGGKFSVDDGEKIIEESLLRPVEGGKKLFLLDKFHTVSTRVQNKLLKLFEEPPEGVYFLLGAVGEYAVLPTVRSRMKTYAETPFSEEAIKAALSRNYGGEIARAAAASGGIYSVAESLLHGDEFQLAESFLTTENPAVFCKSMESFPEKRAFFSALSLLLRDMLFCNEGQEKYANTKEAKKLCVYFPSEAILNALEIVREAEAQMQFNANFGQCLYTLAIGIRKEKEKWQSVQS